MSKILTTQLTGVLQKIQQNEEDAIEETARLLAQAAIGQGTVYFACFGEMQGVAQNAQLSAEPMTKMALWTDDAVITEADRVCIFTRHANDAQALALAEQLYDAFIPFAAIASERADDNNKLSELAYTYVSLNLRGAILPHPTKLGARIVMPHLLVALFVYEAIKLSYDEMLAVDDEADDEIQSPFG
ncbi:MULTISPECIES: DUF2529 family protein [Metasolibacillus]|uniref:DUF2529 family protein n=1 Tax=Metasolibacillus TaxID=2703677 RepID=UPI000792038E|nr:DUF2529 family protein [Metasolibacillus fluoroglycofenilyticus]KYG90205.1 hypothetical protein A0U40_08180 [[Bacillus] sp. KCTC 13219]